MVTEVSARIVAADGSEARSPAQAHSVCGGELCCVKAISMGAKKACLYPAWAVNFGCFVVEHSLWYTGMSGTSRIYLCQIRISGSSVQDRRQGSESVYRVCRCSAIS